MPTSPQPRPEWRDKDQFKFLCSLICSSCSAEKHYDCPRVEKLESFIETLLAEEREKIGNLIGEHNARILNEYQRKYLGGNETILFVPIEEATKQTLSALGEKQ